MVSTILGFNDFFYGTYILKFSKYLSSINHFRSIGPSTQKFAETYPLASFIVFYLSQISGSIFYNLCLGIPIISVVSNFKYFLIYLFFWTMTFHCPKDLFFKVFGESKIEKVFSVLREIERVISVSLISDAVLSTGQNQFSSFIVSFVTINLSYHVIYILDQLIRGVTIRKNELVIKSFTSKITLFVSFVYNYNKYISTLNGKYFFIDMFCIHDNLQLLQIITILTVTLKILYYFGYNILNFDESIIFCPLTKITSFFSIQQAREISSLRSKRSVSVRKDEISILTTDDDDKSTLDDETTAKPVKKRRTTSKARTASKIK